MKTYLDYSRMPEFLAQFFDGRGERDRRLVGVDRLYDSGYYDIVRFYGEDAVRPSAVKLEYLPHPFKLIDPLIREFAAEMEAEFRAAGRLYNGPTVMKVTSWQTRTWPWVVTVQECTYGDQAGSCFALDRRHRMFERWGGTLRWYYKERYPSNDMEQNPLAGGIGVCGYLMINESGRRSVLQVHRTARLASLENSPGPSAAGSVDFVEGYDNLEQMITASMSEEITEELGLAQGEFHIVPLAHTREIFRGEKPQFFCLITTELTREQIVGRLQSGNEATREFDRFEFVSMEMDREARERWLESLNHEARMNYHLIEEYLDLQGGTTA